MALQAGQVVGDFRVERLVGRGGMGEVYAARQESLDRLVALKVVSSHLADDPAFRERFVREARLAASIDHPNVVPIYATGIEGDLVYLAMRFVPGEDLGAVLRQRRPGPAEVVAIAEQLGGALDAAHQRGLIHRDIKPANALLEPGGHVYLTDFGLTKDLSSASSGFTATGQMVGTAAYMAPEVIDQSGIDARSDIYALGCVTYELLAGARPYSGSDIQALFAHVNAPVPSIADARPEAAALAPIVARAMAKSPDDRFLSAGDFARALRAALEGVPVREPEHSVATGAAAFSQAVTRPHAVAAAPTRIQAERPASQTPAATPPVTASRSRRPVIAVLASLAAVLAVGAVVALGLGGGGNEDGRTGAETTRSSDRTEPTTAQKDASDSSSGSGGGTDTPNEPVRLATQLEPCSDPSGWSAQLPTGDGWRRPSRESRGGGALIRTTLRGPGGALLLIDETPREEPGFSERSTDTRQLSLPGFAATATEYTFTGDLVPACRRVCVDIQVTDGQGGGYAVLAGGVGSAGPARKLARAVARSLQPLANDAPSQTEQAFTGGWVVQLASTRDIASADAFAATYTDRTGIKARVLDSMYFPALRAGFFAIVTTHPDREAAVAAARAAVGDGIAGAFARYVEIDPAAASE